MTDRRFDDELRRAAASLATADLPAGLLDPGLAPGDVPAAGGALARLGPLPGFAAAVAAVVVLVGVVVWANPTGPGTPGGPFRAAGAIRAGLAAADYRCRDGGGRPSVAPTATQAPIEAVVCLIPARLEPVRAAYFVLEDPPETVVEIGIKADIEGPTSPELDATLLATVRELAAASAADPGTAAEIGTWLGATLPGLVPGDSAHRAIGGIEVVLERDEGGGYLVRLLPVAG